LELIENSNYIDPESLMLNVMVKSITLFLLLVTELTPKLVKIIGLSKTLGLTLGEKTDLSEWLDLIMTMLDNVVS